MKKSELFVSGLLENRDLGTGGRSLMDSELGHATGPWDLLWHHISHESLDKRSQVFPMRGYKRQQPLIVPSRTFWVAFVPLL